jgi:protein AbiQ
MKNLKMYYIQDDYIDLLRKYDSKVPYNKNHSRPYVGVVIKINDINFFAPMSSPKPKHQTMKNGIDVFKINNGALGVINLNNMIPVPDSALIPVNYSNLSPRYKTLLEDQRQFINNNKISLYKKVDKLYSLYNKNSIPDIAKRCCNFKLLEKLCREYTKNISATIKETAATIKETTSDQDVQNKNVNNILDQVINTYKKEFPAIKYISKKTANNINLLNEKNGSILSIKEINNLFKKSGKMLESDNSTTNKNNYSFFKEINNDLVRCQNIESKLQTNPKSQYSDSINKSIEIEP